MRLRAIMASAVSLGVFGGCDVGGGEDWFARQGPTPATAPARSPIARGPTAAPAGLAGGAELPTEPALADYLRYAALHDRNQGLEAAFNRWRAAVARVPQVKALPDPRFTYRYFIEQVETRVGAQGQSFGLSQTFPWFGKLAVRGDAAAAAARAEHQRYQARKLALFHDVKRAYYEYYYLAQAISVTEENVRLLKLLEGVARARYRADAGSHPDVIRAQVELGKLDDRLRALRELRGPITARLNAAMNRPIGAPLPWPKAVPPRPVAVTEGRLLAWLAEGNPELRAMDAEIARDEQRLALARKEYYPDITVGVDYIDTATTVGAAHPGDDGKDPVVATVSVNLPVWRDRLDAGVREARHRHLAALHEKAQKANALAADLKMALYRFRDADRKLALYRDILLPKARESFKVTRAAYRAGTAGFTDLIDAQRILLEFDLAAERALADRAGHLARLEMLVGREIPSENGTSSPDKPTTK